MSLLSVDPSHIKRARRIDTAAQWIITLGGGAVIVCVLAILILIVSTTVPLFQSPTYEKILDTDLPMVSSHEQPWGLGVDFVEVGHDSNESSLVGYILDRQGKVTFIDFSDSIRGKDKKALPRILGQEQIRSPGNHANAKIIHAEQHSGTSYSLAWSDGSLSLIHLEMQTHFDKAGHRKIVPAIHYRASLERIVKVPAIKASLRLSENGSLTCLLLLPDNQLSVIRQFQSASTGLFEEPTKETRHFNIKDGIPGTISSMTMDAEGRTLYVATSNGCLARWTLGESGDITHHDVMRAFRDQRSITSIAMMQGNASIIVADELGEMTIWTEISDNIQVGDKALKKIRQIHQLSTHEQGVREVHPSTRDKTVASLGERGIVHLDHMTSERNLVQINPTSPLANIAYATRGNAIFGLKDNGAIALWKIDCPHPEISWKTLFGPVHYEGYSKPSYKWQTTGDEPKFSLVPIIFGTLKSTFYAMCFALPLALGSAIYVSYFAAPRFKLTIKPFIEIMAAVPSVVIGFLILLWLAPLLGKWLLAVFLGTLFIPGVLLFFLVVWQYARKFDCAKRIEHGHEFLLLLPAIFFGAILSIKLTPTLENVLFHGDFIQWIYETANHRYDPLNSLAVAIGLGFAIIPIIFSISEDSISNIPHHLTAASLALGASRWQTLWRVVLPSASPGIFAAMMIGFGRAVGETMIVFMAGGNVPLLDMSPFNGFRTLSANIAVEMPEAAKDGTLYRVLFLCAVLLFAMTFALNTIAEVVRHKLRNKYGKY